MPARVLDAASIGPLVPPILDRSGSATVLAAFERSFYLEIGDALIAVGDPTLHDGPLTLRLHGPFAAGLTATLEIETGQRWTVSPDHLYRHDDLTIPWATAHRWQPTLPTTPPDRRHLKEGLVHLRHHLRDRDLSEDGLLGLVMAARLPRNAIERAAKPKIDRLQKGLLRWFAGDLIDPATAIDLLGLGPGLTPSGDDLLGSVLITLRHLGTDAAADHLARDLLQAAVAATHRISQAHLAAAAQGYGAAPLHDLLHDISTPSQRSHRVTLDAVAKMGHSSGFDALAGLVLTSSAWLDAEPSKGG